MDMQTIFSASAEIFLVIMICAVLIVDLFVEGEERKSNVLVEFDLIVWHRHLGLQ